MKPYFEKDGISLYHGDCRLILPHLDPVDVLISDPPNADETDKSIPGLMYFQLLEAIAKAHAKYKWILAKIMRPNYSPLFRFLFGNTHDLKDVGAWVKSNGERLEFLFCLSKEHGEIKGTFPPGHLFEAGDPMDQSIAFPMELPRQILTRFGGHSVLDPCAGTGTTLLVAKELGIQGVGIEIKEKRCQEIADRLLA